ncbi:MAG TPA: SulP family inorganic anion transporter [Ignavibacteriaceae bacterium]|jgi:SulP family sulfate permease|nr:MAG: C4-dicarboxylic acid transporter DauA [Ignavibacteria bacterium ADurb.Bin266]OQY74994.1 MAG: sodium-independent anion transporter [Ignavibacteriales bacterium UTCHB2]HQF41694.1 SulP family inorganic anion transporter [Ignavibacteriaceae bacterium]HQI39464.1 SulP family inorganic anion transporter [Ignavibacteriaceae bacterium]
MLKPKLFTTIKDYSSKQFIMDLSAGTIVGIVALPLAIAFGIASGVTPEKGLITAIIAGFIISFLGGSRVQIGGPTGAFIVIVYGIVHQYGVNGLIIATLMAGVILVIMGFARFGSIIKFIPYPVIVGFTSGIALLIFSTQIKDFFGLQIDQIPSEFFDKWVGYFFGFSTINFYAFGIASLTLATILLFPKITHKIPGSIVALIVTTAIAYFFNLPVETIGSKFGELPSALPQPVFPQIDFAAIRELIQPATTIAILAAIESLLSAVVADGMIGGKHRSNMELIAQGVANIITPLFGGIPATGAIARTATNIKNGGRTPIAGIVHSLVLLLITLFFGHLARLIPLATLAAILVTVAYNMSEWRSFIAIFKSPKSDLIVLLTTFGLTVVFDLTIAIQVGMILAVILFMRSMALVTNVGIITRELKDDDELFDANAIASKKVPKNVEVFEINGPFFFGAVSKFRDAIRIIETPPKVLIIRMRNVPAIDGTGIHALEEVYHNVVKKGTQLILSGVHIQVLMVLDQSGFLKIIGEQNVLGNIDDSLDRAREILGLPKIGRPVDFKPTVKRDLT